jgi:rod shape-determining protein MreC
VATARPGWSRRAQYGLFFSFLAVIGGIIVGLVLLVVSLVAPDEFGRLRGAALDVTGPVASSLHEVTATTQGLFSGAGDYWDAISQNGELKRERKAMLRRMVEARAINQENIQLKAALQLREKARDAIAAGRIVGSSFNSPRRFAILSAGGRDGVRPGMPVRSPDGLVGRIIDVGELSSRILLVSDRTSIVPARLLRNRPGDLIISSGTGGLYPPLVPVARVVKLKGDEAIALPLADPATTSFAIVEPPFEPAAMATENQSSTSAP